MDAYDHFKLMDDSVSLNKMSTKFKRYEKLLLSRREEARAGNDGAKRAG